MKEKFEVKRHYPKGYDISIGMGKLFYAKDLQEVSIALEHYFRPTQEMQFHPKNYSEKNDNCPLCRIVYS